MSKKIFLFPFALLLISSCSNTPETIKKDAESLCNCFKQIFAVDSDNTEGIAKMNAQMEECNTMWKEVYDKYKDDQENKKAFNKAYSECQDN